MFERTSDHKRVRMPAPQESPSTHQTPFYVFPRFELTQIVTLPDGELIQGRRSAVVSDIDNAIKIAGENKLTVKAMPPNEETSERVGRLRIPSDSIRIGYGYVVDAADESLSDAVAKATQVSGAQPESTQSFELHDAETLIEMYEKDPRRRNQVEIVRILGSFMLQHTQE